MDRLYSLLVVDSATEPVDDIFGLEFQDRWEANEARHAAKAAARGQAEPSVARLALARGLAVVSRGSAEAVRHLDGSLAPGK